MNLIHTRTLQKPGRTQSSLGSNDENSTPRIVIPSIAEPSFFSYLKLNFNYFF